MSRVTENGAVSQNIIVRYANIGRAYASDGVTLRQITHSNVGRSPLTSADGNRIQLFFMCDGTETKLEISNRAGIAKAMWDLYINNVLDSSGYDDYAASAADVHREIVLTIPVRPGLNTIELRVNGKNASSTGYDVFVYGASLQ